MGAANLTRGFSWRWIVAEVKVRRVAARRPTNFEVNMTLVAEYYSLRIGIHQDPVNPVPLTLQNASSSLDLTRSKFCR